MLCCTIVALIQIPQEPSSCPLPACQVAEAGDIPTGQFILRQWVINSPHKCRSLVAKAVMKWSTVIIGGFAHVWAYTAQSCDRHMIEHTSSVLCELTMKHHISRVVSSCFFQLRRLRQIHRSVGEEVTKRLVTALILSHLDYCNAVLAGLPQSTLQPLQQVQNAAARLVSDTKPRDHISPVLAQLHWLPVNQRITYKLCLLMHLF